MIPWIATDAADHILFGPGSWDSVSNVCQSTLDGSISPDDGAKKIEADVMAARRPTRPAGARSRLLPGCAAAVVRRRSKLEETANGHEPPVRCISSLRLQRLIAPALFIAPAALALILTMAVPMADAILLSLQHWNGMAPPTWAGFSNYLSLMHDETFFRALWHTAYFTVVHRDPADHPAAADRQPPQFRHPRQHGLPDALLHAGDHFAGHQRPALGHAVRAQFRRREQLPARDRTGQRSPSCGSPTPTPSCRA